MDERHGERGPRPWDDGEREVEELLERAGPRPEVPEEDLEEIAATARSAWRACWGDEALRERRSPWRRRGIAAALGLAAALALAAGLGWWWSLRPSGSPSVVARLESVSGPVLLAGERVRDGDRPIPAGAVLVTEEAAGPPSAIAGRASLRLAGGTTARLDAGSRLRLVSPSMLALERGTVYLDTGTALHPEESPDEPVEVRTALGTVRDVGTQFLVRVVGRDPESMSVRVREGAVVVESAGATFRAGAGRELVVHRDGRTERRRVPGYGPAWEWVIAAAPPFDLEGRSLEELLNWVSRETGWRIRYEDPELAAAASEIVLHGSLGGLRPDQAPFAVLPGAGIEGELEDAVLVVRRGN